MKNKFSKAWKYRKAKVKLNDKGISCGKNNDIAWYSQNPVLLKIAGTMNFLYRAGRNIIKELVPSSWQSDSGYEMLPSVPGIISLNWIPTPGVSTDAHSPIMVAANKFFTALRLKNFSTSVYDPADVMFYFMACDSIFAFYAYLTLVYNHAMKFEFENQYYPRAILEALNVDYEDIILHLDDLLFYINLSAEKLSKLRVPKDVYFIARHMHMSAQVYKDTENIKSQLYVFVPQYLNKYDATVPELKPIAIGAEPNKMTFSDLKSKFDSMLNAILPDEDMMVIAADVQKYLDRDYWTVNQLDWNSRQEPVYNKEMLWQIHNADFLPYTSVDGLNITQIVDSNLNTIIKFDPVFTTNEAGVELNRIIDSNSDAPTPEEVVEATRLKFAVTNFTQTGVRQFTCKLFTCGSEILTNAKVFYYDKDNNLTSIPVLQFISVNSGTIESGTAWVFPQISESIRMSYDFLNMFVLKAFQYSPIQYLCLVNAANPAIKAFVGINGEVDNYAIIENVQLKALNDQCLFSQFDLGSKI